MNEDIADYCYVTRATDNDVAVLISSTAFDEASPSELHIEVDGLRISQDGVDRMACPLPEEWAVKALQEAPRLTIVNILRPGRPDEYIGINEIVRLV